MATKTPEKRVEHAAPEQTFYSITAWAKANDIGVNAVREFCRRSIDPMPHLKIGNRYLIDDGPAVAWLRRKLGVGYLR